MKILYYDCFSGISGDMHLGAMLDLGVDRDYLLNELKRLDMGPYQLNIYLDKRRGITGTKVDVLLGHEGNVHTHDHAHTHTARTFRHIVRMIGESALSAFVKTLSLDIFTRMAEAEGKIHGQAVEDVHFHEVGAVDSIVDIIGAAVCLDFLKVERIMSSPIQVGGGFVKCAHGLLPVPAPATVELLRGIPIKSGLVPFETTTPTGAAILAAIVGTFTETVEFVPEKIGYGIGHRDTDIPNVLRVFLGHVPDETARKSDPERGEAVILECNLDDMNPELYEVLMERLFEAGAHDVFFTPIIMKKSRPAVTVSVLCDTAQQPAMEDIMWRHSSTFGLRSHKVFKAMLRREFRTVVTPYGDIAVKDAYLNGRMIKSKPEYEDCKKLARENGVNVEEIYKFVHDAERIRK